MIEEGPPSLVGREVYGTSGPELSFVSDGAHAEYCVVKEDALAMKPKSLSFKQAAAVGTSYTTASLVLERIQVRSGDVVLILGSTGSVGSAAAALAKATGCHVLTASRRDGTDVNIAKDPTLSAAKELTSGKGPDLVVDTVGDAKLIRAALDIMNAGGRLGFISAPRSGSTEMAVDILSFYRRNISLVGTNSLTVVASKMAQKMQEMSALFDSGKLEAPVTDRIKLISLAEAADVYAGKLEIIHPLIDMQGTERGRDSSRGSW